MTARTTRVLLGLVVAGLVVAGLLVAAQDRDIVQPSAGSSTLDVALEPCPEHTGEGTGTGLPRLSLPCLGGGPDVSLGEAPGTPTVVNLWATWCGPCREELPIFQQLHDSAGESVRMLGVVEQDTVEAVRAYVEQIQLTFPSLLDADGALLTAGGFSGLPVTYFVRADGSIAHLQIGPIPSYDVLLGLIAEHLDVTVVQ